MHSYPLTVLLSIYFVLNLIGAAMLHLVALYWAPKPPDMPQLVAHFLVCSLIGIPVLLGVLSWQSLHHLKTVVSRHINFGQDRPPLSEPRLTRRRYSHTVVGK
jgi:hypothetical protein